MSAGNEQGLAGNHRIIESLRLEKTSKIIKSSRQPKLWCALAELLPCRVSESDLYKNHMDLCQATSLSQLYGLPLLVKSRPMWAASVNASKRF